MSSCPKKNNALFFQQPNTNIIDLVQLMLFPEKPQHGAHGELHDALMEREIVAQSMTFLLAGYETTSAVLAYFCHELAKHPEVQARLHQEIADNIGMVRSNN